MSGRTIRQRLLATTTVAGAVLLAMPAFAQTTQEAPIAPAADNPAPSTAPAVSADGATTANTTTGGDIIVTGSRIPHPELESASPVTIVGAQEVAVSGVTRTEDLLNALPQVFAGQGGNISNGSTGTATLNLRGIGAVRTLVLVNGRRLVPGDPRSPLSDINIIPAALIKRVDVLTGGASSVYGADAVAGVVNFVMDTEFDGFKLDGQYSFYQHNNGTNKNVTDALDARGFGYPKGSVADGGGIDVSAVFGAGFDDGRGHVTAYGNYRKIDPITQDRRDYSACSLTALPQTAKPPSHTDVDTLHRNFNCGGSGTSAPGSFYTPTGGYYHVEGNQFVPGQVLYNFAPSNYFQRPDERYTAGFFAHYDVADAFKPYAEFMFMDDRTIAQIAPSGDFFNTATINCDNPLLSAQQLGVACNEDNTFVDSDGVTRANLYIARRNIEGGGRRDDLQHTTYRGVFGAKGDLSKGLSYEAYYQYSRVNFAQTYRNDFGVSRIAKALDVVSVDADNNIVAPNAPGSHPVCRITLTSNDATDQTCAPWNVFTQGAVSQAALNYLQVPLLSRGQTTEQIANGSFTFLGGEYGLTSPFATEGFALNFGGEYRKETINFEVDSNFLSGEGAGQGGPTTPVAGQLKVTEGFVEASLPVIQDRRFFEDLRFGAGYRRSHYETNGIDPVTQQPSRNQFNTDTWKAEGSWAPVRDLKFRFSFNHAIRAPNAVELYGALSFGLDGSVDPCSGNFNPNDTIPEPTASQAACALTGVTAAQYGSVPNNPANQYNGYFGGNSQLTPEVANSFTAGAVITPTFLRGFQATIDYFNIRLGNQISIYGSDSIIANCLGGDQFYCSRIFRNTTNGTLARTPTLEGGGYVQDFNVNAGRLTTKGIDITLGYTQDLGHLGNLGLSLVGTYLDTLITDSFGPSKFDCTGFYGPQCGTPSPEWRHKFRATYTSSLGPSFSVAWRYFSSVRAETLSSDTDLNGNATPIAAPGNAKIPSQTYIDLALTAPIADKFTFKLGVNNVFDREPPLNGYALGVVGNGNTFPQVYDALGRYLFAGVSLDF